MEIFRPVVPGHLYQCDEPLVRRSDAAKLEQRAEAAEIKLARIEGYCRQPATDDLGNWEQCVCEVLLLLQGKEPFYVGTGATWQGRALAAENKLDAILSAAPAQEAQKDFGDYAPFAKVCAERDTLRAELATTARDYRACIKERNEARERVKELDRDLLSLGGDYAIQREHIKDMEREGAAGCAEITRLRAIETAAVAMVKRWSSSENPNFWNAPAKALGVAVGFLRETSPGVFERTEPARPERRVAERREIRKDRFDALMQRHSTQDCGRRMGGERRKG